LLDELPSANRAIMAQLTDRLRADPGSVGLCSANGGFLTKHAIGLYSTEPPAAGVRWADVQAEVDAIAPGREAVGDYDGKVAVETWTVMHDRDGQPEVGLAAVRIDDGRRAWGTTRDADTLAAMVTEEFAGRPAQLSADGELRF
jgi:acetyl-CoA C-acetyltransferase